MELVPTSRTLCYLEFLSVSLLGSCERTVLVLAYKLAFMVYVTWDQSYSRGVQSSRASAQKGFYRQTNGKT